MYRRTRLIEPQHIPILRYLARELGSYDGVTNEAKYTVDAVADIYIDWRVSTSSIGGFDYLAKRVLGSMGCSAEQKDRRIQEQDCSRVLQTRRSILR